MPARVTFKAVPPDQSPAVRAALGGARRSTLEHVLCRRTRKLPLRKIWYGLHEQWFVRNSPRPVDGLKVDRTSAFAPIPSEHTASLGSGFALRRSVSRQQWRADCGRLAAFLAGPMPRVRRFGFL
jgi:hypothetical protein